MTTPKKTSWRHHYIPKFQLRGFTDPDGKLFIFDKSLNRPKRGSYSPTSHFFEPHRNTVTVPGVDPEVVERYYAEYETTGARLFERLRSNPQPTIDLRMIQDLKCYISVLFWRLPESDKYLDLVVRRLGLEGLGIRLLHPDTKEPIIWPEFETLVLTNPDFRKGIRFLHVPLATFDLFVQEYDQTNWAFYRGATEGPSFHICSDNPLVFEKHEEAFEFRSNLAFPASSNCLVFYSPKGEKPTMLDADMRMDLDCLVFRQAERYVCGPNADYLQSIAELTILESKHLTIEQHKARLFSGLRDLSQRYPTP